MTATEFYILDETGEKPVPCLDPWAWADWYMDFTHRRVARTFIGGDIFISTVFLALDHSQRSVPKLWETMVFRMQQDGEMIELDCQQCAGNREQAQAQHMDICERVRAVLALDLEPA